MNSAMFLAGEFGATARQNGSFTSVVTGARSVSTLCVSFL